MPSLGDRVCSPLETGFIKERSIPEQNRSVLKKKKGGSGFGEGSQRDLPQHYHPRVTDVLESAQRTSVMCPRS